MAVSLGWNTDRILSYLGCDNPSNIVYCNTLQWGAKGGALDVGNPYSGDKRRPERYRVKGKHQGRCQKHTAD